MGNQKSPLPKKILAADAQCQMAAEPTAVADSSAPGALPAWSVLDVIPKRHSAAMACHMTAVKVSIKLDYNAWLLVAVADGRAAAAELIDLEADGGSDAEVEAKVEPNAEEPAGSSLRQNV